MKKIFILIYVVILSVHLYAGSREYTEIAFFTKPALLISLIVFFLIDTNRKGSAKFRNLILLGLIFSLGGDVFLMFQGIDSGYFIAGLVSFLMAHIFYVWAFTITYLNNHVVPLIKRQGWVMILILAYGILFFRAIKDDVGSLIVPIFLYTTVITLMLLMAVNRQGRVGLQSFWLIAIGAALFVASDSFLAWNKFVEPLPESHFLVMSTYGLAQLFIVMGAVNQIQQVAEKMIKIHG